MEGFTLCYEKSIDPAVETKLLKETPKDLKQIAALFTN